MLLNLLIIFDVFLIFIIFLVWNFWIFLCIFGIWNLRFFLCVLCIYLLVLCIFRVFLFVSLFIIRFYLLLLISFSSCFLYGRLTISFRFFFSTFLSFLRLLINKTHTLFILNFGLLLLWLRFRLDFGLYLLRRHMLIVIISYKSVMPNNMKRFEIKHHFWDFLTAKTITPISANNIRISKPTIHLSHYSAFAK